MSSDVLDEAPVTDPVRPQPSGSADGAAGQKSASGGGRSPVAFSEPVTIAIAILTMLAVAAVWLVFYGLVLSGFQQNHSQHELYAKLRVELAGETAPLGGQIKEGAPVALVSIPGAGLHNEVVVEGTSSKDLQNGPGHLVDTVLPGQAGVSVLFGKSVTFGAPFAHVAHLAPGSVITATTGQGTFTYHVIDVRRAHDPLPARLTGKHGRLTLVAAVGSGWQGRWAPSQIVYVDAALQGAGKATLGGGPIAVPANQESMARDRSALTPLVLWLELLVVAAIAVVWTRSRWGKWQVWVVGIPALLAVMWVVTETAARLVPNLL